MFIQRIDWLSRAKLFCLELQIVSGPEANGEAEDYEPYRPVLRGVSDFVVEHASGTAIGGRTALSPITISLER